MFYIDQIEDGPDVFGSRDMETDHLNDEQKRIAEAIIQAAGGSPNGGGCKAFYTPSTWADRGESYGTESVLIVCHDGGDLASYFNLDYMCYEMHDKMMKALEEIGYWAEQCTSWYTAIYKQ